MRRPRLVLVSLLAGVAALAVACASTDTESERAASSTAALSMSDWAISNLAAGDFATWAATPGVQILTGKFLAPGTNAVDRARAVDSIALVGGSGWVTIPVAHVDGDHVAYTNEWVGADFNARAHEPGARVLTGDFDSNGRLDIAILGSASSTAVHLAFSNGDGTWRMVEGGTSLMASAAAMAGVRPTLGDFNGDGYSDIALPGATGASNIPVFFSNGDGTFAMQSFASSFTSYVNAPGAKLFCADFDGDHKDDLALVGGTGWTYVPVALSNGDGSFRTTTTAIDSFGYWATLLDAHGARVASFTGDFNGDGRADLGLAGGNGWATIPLAFSNGDGSFTVRNGWVGDFDAWANQTAIAPFVRDFDGDHKDDVALAGGGGWGTIPVARSQGDGSFVVQNMGGVNVGPFDSWAKDYFANLVTGEFVRPGEMAIGLVGGAGWWTVPFAEPRCDGATCLGVFTGQVTTQHNDNARTGSNQDEAVLTPASVRPATFGKLFQWDVVGQVFAQPLYVPNAIEGRDMVYVATEANWIYAFDAKATSATAPKRQVQIGLPVPGRLPLNTPWPHNNVWPIMGVTGTPVVDRASNTLFVVAAEMVPGSTSDTGVLKFKPVFRLHALDLASMAERPNSPVTIVGQTNTHRPQTFSPAPYLQRAGLLLAGDQLYVAFGSNTGDYTVPDPSYPFYAGHYCPAPGHEHDAGACDCGPAYPVDPAGQCPLDPKMNYEGWIMSYSKKTLAQSGVFVSAPFSFQGGIWQGGNGLVANERGDIYVQTGNGLDAVNDFGNSLLRLVRFPRWPGIVLGGKLTVPTTNDNDLGSAGAMLVPGTNHLVGGGKDGVVFVLDQNMAGTATPLWQGTLGDAAHHGPHSIVGSPAFWNGNVYLWGQGDVVRSIPVTGAGLLDGLSADGASSTLAPPRVGTDVAPSSKGAFLTITSRGNDPGTAIVWANVPSGDEAATRLVAYDAADLRSPIWTSDLPADAIDGGARFATPTVAGGRAFLGSYKLLALPSDHVDGQIEGHVTVFGPVPPRDVSDAGSADSGPSCRPAGTDPIDTSWNVAGTSIYPTYFKGSRTTDSLGHCAGCHLPGGSGAYKWSYASDDAATFYNALTTITPALMPGPLVIDPALGDPKLSILGDPARTPLTWYAPTSGLSQMPKDALGCDAHAARAITAWLAAGAPR